MATARVRELFEAAADLPVGDRAAFLDRACAGDAELRKRVDGLLSAVEDAGGFLGTPTKGGLKGGTTVAAPSERAGEVIGRYKLLQQIGEGGFGVVFMAEQEQPVRRRVALKIIKLGMDTRAVIARFEAERQALAMMDHPNIARVFDAGSTDTGRPYFVMELVKGVPITEYADTNNLSTRERLELFVPVCRAVQHAHQKGIIHRDIKPANVLVTLHDGEPVAKVIDFGIAKATDHRLTEKTVFTEFRQLIGTPEYMSPEQAEMSGLDVDTRSDVYSLGVLLYELLTGTTPFDGSVMRSKAYDQIQKMIREVDPPRPSVRISTLGETLTSVAGHRKVEAGKLSRLVKGDLDWIVMRCLEKDRTRRYDTASDLAADVGRHLGGEAVEAAPPGVGYRVRKFVRRNRGVVGAGVVVCLVLTLGIAGTTTGFVREFRQRRIAEELRVRERTERERAETALNTIQGQAEVIRRTLYADSVQAAFAAYDGWRFDMSRDLLERCPSDIRGWEWEYVRGRTNVESRTLRAGASNCTAVAISRKSGMLAAASADRLVRIWDLKADREDPSVVLPPHAAPVTSLSFSSDDRLVVTACGDDVVRVWSAESGDFVRELRGDLQAVSMVRTPGTGSWCAGAGQSRQVCIWDLATGKVLGLLDGHESPVTALCVSPVRGRLLSGDSNGGLVIWDVDRKRALGSAMHVTQAGLDGAAIPVPIACVAWGGESRVTVGVSRSYPTAQVSGWAPGLPQICVEPLSLFAIDELGCSYAQREPDGYFAGGSGQSEPGALSKGVAVSADGQWTAIGRDDGTIDVRRGYQRREARLLWRDPPVGDEDSVLGLSAGTCLTMHDMNGRILVAPLDPEFPGVGCAIKVEGINRNRDWAVATSGDGRRVVAARDDGRTRVYDTFSGNEIGGWETGLQAVVLTTDGTRAIEAGAGRIQIRRVPSGELIREIEPGVAAKSLIERVALSPDQKLVAYGTDTGAIGIVELATGRRLWEAIASEPSADERGTVHDALHKLMFDPASRRLLVSGGSVPLSLWSVESGAMLSSAMRTTDVYDMCFAADGERFFTIQSGCGLSAWSTVDLRRLLTWSGRASTNEHSVFVSGQLTDDIDIELGSLCLSPDGRDLVCFGQRGLWLVPLSDNWGMTGIDKAVLRISEATAASRRLEASATSLLDLRQMLKSSPNLDESQKKIAASVEPTSVDARASSAWETVRRSGATESQYKEALSDATFAASVRSNDGEIKRTLGAALCRMGRWGEAIEVLRESDQRIQASSDEDLRDGLPSCVAFLAMAQFKLGQFEEYKGSITRLKSLSQKPIWRGNADVAMYIQEAERLENPF